MLALPGSLDVDALGDRGRVQVEGAVGDGGGQGSAQRFGELVGVTGRFYRGAGTVRRGISPGRRRVGAVLAQGWRGVGPGVRPEVGPEVGAPRAGW